MITQSILKEILFFETNGEVRHNKPGTFWHNKKVGTLHHGGYIVHTVRGKQYNIHRLIFLYFHGYLPPMVDHYDQCKTNNSISNLVPSDVKHNGMNRRLNKNNTSGRIGVVWSKARSKWKAQIKVDGKSISIGNYSKKEDAISARVGAEIKYGFCSNHGGK